MATTTARSRAANVQDSWSASQGNSSKALDGQVLVHAPSSLLAKACTIIGFSTTAFRFRIALLLNVNLDRQRAPYLIIITIPGVERRFISLILPLYGAFLRSMSHYLF